MKKLFIAMFVVVFALQATFAAVSITTTSKTFQKAGGAASIVVTGEGAWTATSDSPWIVIKQGSSGTGAGSCVYIINANTTADVRVGHITIGGNTYTITQYGYDVTLSPSSATFDRKGGSGNIAVTVDAGITWTAIANESWITVSPKTGTSVGNVAYQVEEYSGVVTRVGTITIGSQTFAITQTGVDMSITPATVVCGENADIINVTVTARSSTEWTVRPNASWISIIDKESGYGDYILTLAVSANTSFQRRTGTVAIGSAELTIVQGGLASASLAINPTEATVSASGAYGNVAVYATPDATWSAISLTPWLTISEGVNGASNGNIKYIASANPTLEERTGTIKITPPYKAPVCDLYADMIFELSGSRYGYLGTNYNATGMGNRYANKSLPYSLTGSQAVSFSGDALPAKDDNSFAFAFSFSVGELGCVNRLLTMGALSVYLDIENRLWVNNAPTTFAIDSINTDYVVALSQSDEGVLSVYAGLSNASSLGKACETKMPTFDFSYPVEMSEFKFGYTQLPTSGYLINGRLSSIRMWLRELTSYECEQINTLTTLYDSMPAYVPTTISDWWYFPLDGNAYYGSGLSKFNTLYVFEQYKKFGYSLAGVSLSGLNKNCDRFGLKAKALHGKSDGKIVFPEWRRSVIETNRAEYVSGNYKIDGTNYNYKFELSKNVEHLRNMSISMWLRVDRLPTGKIEIVSKKLSSTFLGVCRGYYSSGNVPYYRYALDEATYPISRSDMMVVLGEDGVLSLKVDESTTSFSSFKIPVGEWIMLSILGKSSNSIAIYCNDLEIGNVSCSYSLGDLHANIDYTWYGYEYDYSYGKIKYGHEFEIGGYNGAIDDLVIYDGLLTAVDVRALYNAGKPNIIYHTVTQGVQEPKLATDNGIAPAVGSRGAVALTIAQSVQWQAKSNCEWIILTSDTEGTGSASIAYQVMPNQTAVPRTGTLTIAGLTYTITQAGMRADVTCDVSNFGVVSDFGTIRVDVEGSGRWTATTDADWIHILTEEGSGSNSVMFVVDDYTTTTQSRIGTITIAGKKVIITQQGYELSIDPMIADVGSNAGAGEFGVAAPVDAVWEAIADCDWITIIGSRTGIGDGVIQYTIADNLTGETRTGRIVVGGKTYTITQRTTLPLTTQVVGSGSVTGAGNYNQGTQVTLKAVSAQGYEFSHWSGDAVGVTDSVTINMDTAKNVTATFIPEAAAQVLAEKKAAQGGFYTRDQIHALEVGNLVLDVDAASGTARVGVQLMETSDLSDPNSWKPVNMTQGNLDVGNDGTVGLNVKATGNAKFFKVVVPQK